MKELYDDGMDEIPREKVEIERMDKEITSMYKKLEDAKIDSEVEAELLTKQKK